MAAPVEVRATTDPPLQTGADTVCVGLVEGEGVPHDVADGALGALVESGEASTRPRRVAVAHAEGVRWLLVGLGARDDLDTEAARVAAAVAETRARELGARTLGWELPHHVDDAFAGGLVEGTLLSAYRFDRFKSDVDDDAPGRLEALVVSAHHDVSDPVDRAALVAEAANAARDLQNAPANELTPTRLGERARELADEIDGLTARWTAARRSPSGRWAPSGPWRAEATRTRALITMRYEPADVAGPRARARGQGGHLRHRRDLDQAGGEDGTR